MTPEMIRAADRVANPLLPIEGPFFHEAAQALATAILAHRSDYGQNGEPLPVDEAFCEQMGLSEGTSVAGNRIYWKTLGSETLMWHYRSQSMHFGGIEMPATRPQLRQLIEALGGGAA